jgi:hypothetical protein
VKFIWILKLPFSFILDGETNQRYKINEKLSVSYLNAKRTPIDKMEVKLNWHLSKENDKFDMFTIYNDYEKAKAEIGSIINKLYTSLANELKSYLLKIYNGDDFIVPYVFYIVDNEEKKVLYQLDSASTFRVITNDTMQGLINEIKEDNNKIVDDLIAQSEFHLENGLYDMAIINCHTALEVFLGEFFKNKKPTTPIKEEMLKELMKSNKLIDKYLHFSSYLIYGRSLEQEDNSLFMSLLDLNSLRNNVAHEGTALTNKRLLGKTNEEVYAIIESLIWNVESAIDWVNFLENPIKLQTNI